VQPIVLAPNQPETFYRGSGRLAAFRGLDLPPRPEDWVASTTARFGQEPVGLSPLPDGGLLRDAVAADPVGWLGAAHVERFGTDTGVLVKLLDAGERLPVHVHPTRAFARSHLARPYGKSEAWIIVDAAPGAQVHLGFNRDVEREELRSWVADQDVRALLSATNTVPVTAGDVLFCPAGAPHAIGSDILLVEVQEPSDFSVLLEREGFPVAADDAFLGLPAEVALECVDRGAVDRDRLAQLRGAPTGSLLPAAAEEFFTARLLEAGDETAGFAVLVAVDGAGTLTGDWGRMPVPRGTTIALPAGAGAARVEGAVRIVRCGPGTSAP
jgi:mannose-6-phosphate isomerase